MPRRVLLPSPQATRSFWLRVYMSVMKLFHDVLYCTVSYVLFRRLLGDADGIRVILNDTFDRASFRQTRSPCSSITSAQELVQSLCLGSLNLKWQSTEYSKGSVTLPHNLQSESSFPLAFYPIPAC